MNYGQSQILEDSEIQEQSKSDLTIEPSNILERMLKQLNLPIEYPDYSNIDYWNSRYSRSLGTNFEWLQPYQIIKPFIHKILFDRYEVCKVLYPGCGNSQLAEEMYQDGIKDIICVDFSDVLIRQLMNSSIPYLLMDVTQKMEFENETFDLIIDKCLLDSILAGEFFFEKSKLYLNECKRILKKKGVLMIISYGHPDTRIIYLKQFNVNIQEVKKMKIDDLESSSIDTHFVYICINN